MKNNKGITLIALIITIIILLILAGITINAVLGEDGILARARESATLTNIADTLFDLESEIVDINSNSLLASRKLISSDIISELIKRNKLVNTGNSFFWSDSGSLNLETEITDGKPKGLTLSFNGDVWLDNYKRGKINLSSNIESAYSDDKQVKITVIDGTIEVVDGNKFILHSFKHEDLPEMDNEGTPMDRDFVCWINQYGEIVSDSRNTIITKKIPGEYEYTAIYEDYKYWRDSAEGEMKNIIGIESEIVDRGAGYYSLEARAEAMFQSYYYYGLTMMERYGTEISNMGVYFATDYNDLIFEAEKWNPQSGYYLNYTTENNFIGPSQGIMVNSLYGFGADGTAYYVPMAMDRYNGSSGGRISAYNNDEYFRKVSTSFTNFTSQINAYKAQGVTRLYYRTFVSYNMWLANPSAEIGNYEKLYVQTTSGETWEGSMFESTIKYIDL